MSDSDSDVSCPLCMEDMDISDRHFKPCSCGYQICRFCWHHIKENLNGKCPACRRDYTDTPVEFTPIPQEEIARLKSIKKAREREKKGAEANNRKQLANMRVVRKNLVYVTGLSAKVASEELLRQNDYFGKYGKILKIVVNKRAPSTTQASGPSSLPSNMIQSIGVYITYAKKEDAARAIAAVDGSYSEGRILRASYGTTKYCTYYLRNTPCPNPNCMYLHEPGEEGESFTKEDISTGKYQLRDMVKPSTFPCTVKGKSIDSSHKSSHRVGVSTVSSDVESGSPSGSWTFQESHLNEANTHEISPELETRNFEDGQNLDENSETPFLSATSTPSFSKNEEIAQSLRSNINKEGADAFYTTNDQENVSISSVNHPASSHLTSKDPFSDFLQRAGQLPLPQRSPVSPNYKPLESSTEFSPPLASGQPINVGHLPTRRTSRFGFAQTSNHHEEDGSQEVGYIRPTFPPNLHNTFGQMTLDQEPSSDISSLPTYHPSCMLPSKTFSTNPENVDSLFGGPDPTLRTSLQIPSSNSFISGIPSPPGVLPQNDYHSANEFFSHFLRRASVESPKDTVMDKIFAKATVGEKHSGSSISPTNNVFPSSVRQRDFISPPPTKSTPPEFRDPAIMAIRYSSPSGTIVSTATTNANPRFAPARKEAPGSYPSAFVTSPGSNSNTLNAVGMGQYFSSRPFSNSSNHSSPQMYSQGRPPFYGSNVSGNLGYANEQGKINSNAMMEWGGAEGGAISPMANLVGGKGIGTLPGFSSNIQPLSHYPNSLPNRSNQSLPTAYSHYGSLTSQGKGPANSQRDVIGVGRTFEGKMPTNTSTQGSRSRLKIFENVTNENTGGVSPRFH